VRWWHKKWKCCEGVWRVLGDLRLCLIWITYELSILIFGGGSGTLLYGLFQCLSSNSTFESSDQVNGWMMDVCRMMLSLKSHGLATATHVQSYHVLNSPVLERVITSHLQTFGCTVVMGTSSEDINSVSYTCTQVASLFSSIWGTLSKVVLSFLLFVRQFEYSALNWCIMLQCS
jgi:hypothetical protein